MSSSVPDIPGDPIPHNSEQGRWLRAHVASLCGLEHDRYLTPQYDMRLWPHIRRSFPGAQPVSFGTKDLDRLENAEWVVPLIPHAHD
jgi:mRNA guanylyltransferase